MPKHYPLSFRTVFKHGYEELEDCDVKTSEAIADYVKHESEDDARKRILAATNIAALAVNVLVEAVQEQEEMPIKSRHDFNNLYTAMNMLGKACDTAEIPFHPLDIKHDKSESA